MEKEMATHSSVLAWRIPGTVEPGGLPSMESHRVGHDWSDLAAAAAACEPERGLFPVIWHLWTSVVQKSPLNFTIQWEETIPFPMRSEAQPWGEDPFSNSTLPLVISLSPRVPFRVHSAFFSYFSIKVRRRQWHPTPVFLTGESQGRRNLVDCRLRGRTESDTTEMT